MGWGEVAKAAVLLIVGAFLVAAGFTFGASQEAYQVHVLHMHIDSLQHRLSLDPPAGMALHDPP